MRIFNLVLLLSLTGGLAAQWTPGEVYREYVWTTPADHHEAFLRVGGRYGYQAQPDKLPAHLQDGDYLLLPDSLDLSGALRAEVTLEKVMSHEDSRDLRVAVNDGDWISVPEPADIPVPQTEYMYHTALTVPVPLADLRTGRNNRFRLRLAPDQRWNWPQNVFYALIFRVYYAPDATPLTLTVPAGDIGPVEYLRIATSAFPAGDSVTAADYVFVGRDVDWSGRGVNERTHWQTHRGRPHRTLGSSTEGPDFSVRWNTEWLPDQEAFGVQARVRTADGRYHVSAVTEGLRLAPRPYTIALYAPEPAPRNWVTRSGEFTQTITVPEPVEDATAYRLHWTSWSPCYSNGLFLNDHLVWGRNDDCYVFATHAREYDGHALPYLQKGENVIRTALTPLMRGKMVHGMEVQWPGVQLVVRRYR